MILRRLQAVELSRVSACPASPVTHCNPFLGEGIVGSIGLPFPGTDSKVIDMDTEKKFQWAKMVN